jgi:pyruvate/2-oxoglutarate/acetoin dehydrogenase E1 component
MRRSRTGPGTHRRMGGRWCGMAELITYRQAVSEGIAREMRRDASVVCLGEDMVWPRASSRPRQGSSPSSVRSECGIRRSPSRRLSVRVGAAMTGMCPVAEIMFSDFFACCYDYWPTRFPRCAI